MPYKKQTVCFVNSWQPIAIYLCAYIGAEKHLGFLSNWIPWGFLRLKKNSKFWNLEKTKCCHSEHQLAGDTGSNLLLTLNIHSSYSEAKIGTDKLWLSWQSH